MFYDAELPNGYQDADLEMASLVNAGNRAAVLASQGLCTHGWLTAPVWEPTICNDCGKLFETAEMARTEGRARLLGLDE